MEWKLAWSDCSWSSTLAAVKNWKLYTTIANCKLTGIVYYGREMGEWDKTYRGKLRNRRHRLFDGLKMGCWRTNEGRTWLTKRADACGRRNVKAMNYSGWGYLPLRKKWRQTTQNTITCHITSFANSDSSHPESFNFLSLSFTDATHLEPFPIPITTHAMLSIRPIRYSIKPYIELLRTTYYVFWFPPSRKLYSYGSNFLFFFWEK